jgi:WD40 repeat protein/CHAT domain-containing protein
MSMSKFTVSQSRLGRWRTGLHWTAISGNDRRIVCSILLFIAFLSILTFTSSAMTIDSSGNVEIPLPDGATTRLGEGTIHAIAYSPDGQTLAVATSLGIELRRTDTLALYGFLAAHSRTVRSISFSLDGLKLASGSDDQRICLWEVATGRLLHALEGHAGTVECVAFSPDGLVLASGSEDGSIRLWDTSTGQLQGSIAAPDTESIAFFPDGSALASASTGGNVRFWSTDNGSKILSIPVTTCRLSSLAISHDGEAMAVVSAGGPLFLLDVHSGEVVRVLTGHSGAYSVAYSPDGRYLLLGSYRGTFTVLDAETGKTLLTVAASDNTACLVSAAFSPDGATIASGSKDHELKLWSSVTGNPTGTANGECISRDGPATTALSPDGKVLASGSFDGTVDLWDAKTGDVIESLSGHTSSIRCVAFSPDGTRLVSGEFEGELILWNLTTGTPLHSLSGHSSSVECVSFSPDGTMIASGSQDDHVRLWDVATGSTLHAFEAHSGDVRCIAFSPDGKILASGEAWGDGRVKLWDVSSGNLLGTLICDRDTVNSLAFSPDGTTLATGSQDKPIQVWDVASRTLLWNVASGPLSEVNCIAYSPDGTLLATGGTDQRVRIWDASSGLLYCALQGHTDEVDGIEFSLDGKLLASSSSDGTALMWNVEQALQSSPSHFPLVGTSSDTGVASRWPIVYQDDFGDSDSGWDLHWTCRSGASDTYVDGSYEIIVGVPSRLAWSLIPIRHAHDICDFVIDIAVQAQEGHGAQGILFRYEDSRNFLCFMISSDGRYWVGKFRDGVWETIIDWTIAEAFQTSQPTRLAVASLRDEFAFSINGTEVAKMSDGTYRCGEIGLGVMSSSEARFVAGFEAITVRAEPEIAHIAARAIDMLDTASAYKHIFEINDEAIKTYLDALVLFEQIGWSHRIAECANGAAWYELRSGRYMAGAISHYEQALVIQQTQGNLTGKAWTLTNLGLCYYKLCDYQRARDYYERSLALFRDLEDRSGEATNLNRLGNWHLSLADSLTAIDCLEESLAIYHELRDRDGESACLNNLGNCYKSLGEYGVAIDRYEESLTVFPDQGEYGRAITLGNLSMLYFDSNRIFNWRRSLEYLEEALVIYRNLGARRDEAWILKNLGRVYRSRFDYEKAIEYYDQALSLSVEVGDREEECFVHWGLGQTYRAREQPETAMTHYESAITIVESIRGAIGDEDLRQSYFGSLRILYEEYLELLLLSDREEEAILVAERCRARTFLDLIAAGPVEALESIAEEGVQTGVVEVSVIESDLAETISQLPADTAALEYFITDDATYLWVVHQGQVQGPLQLPVGRGSLMEQIINCRQAIEAGDPMADFHLAALYDTLIAPVGGLLPVCEDTVPHLIIVPSGPLYYLPFQALLRVSEDREERDRLIERYTISYTPSLVTLKYVQQAAAKVFTEVAFLALADPSSGDSTMGRLPEAQTESRRVASLFLVSEVYVDTAATESVVQSRSSVASHLLFSTHGSFNPVNPMYSYLLLSPDEGSDGRLYTHEVFGLPLSANLVVLSACETLLPSMSDMEGQIRAVRAVSDDESVELTQGQLETLISGDEIAGLTRAFLYAGTSSVLSSLWSVPSGSTSQLMIAFYSHMNKGMDKAQALRAAQLEVMNTPGCTQPVYWAAFNLMGDWR